MASLTLSVEGMTCSHCAEKVTQALEGVPGVRSADVSLEENRAEVVFDAERAEVEDLVRAVDEEGYVAKAI